jgi:hypothetical protein
MATTKKTVSAAEAARREAQSAEDKGEEKRIVVDVDGIHIDIRAKDLDDYEALDALQNNVPNPMVNIFLPDPEDRAKQLDKLRDEEGKIRGSRVIQWVADVFKAMQLQK